MSFEEFYLSNCLLEQHANRVFRELKIVFVLECYLSEFQEMLEKVSKELAAQFSTASK